MLRKKPADYTVREIKEGEWAVHKKGTTVDRIVKKRGVVWECDPAHCEAARYGHRFNCKHIDYVKDDIGFKEEPLPQGPEAMTEALKYSQLGWSVIPVAFKGKNPLVKWEQYQTKRAEESEIIRWYRNWPVAGIGVVTGAISRIVVVDVDKKGLRNPIVAELDALQTRVHKTGNGFHYVFKHPGFPINNTVGLWYEVDKEGKIVPSGIDFRGDGGYIVVPPSMHVSGVRYEVVRDTVPKKLPKWILAEVKRRKEKNDD